MQTIVITLRIPEGYYLFGSACIRVKKVLR